MTEEAQRIAIAEAAGWILVDDKLTGRPPGISDHAYWRDGNQRTPDFLNDLNAMAEAERHGLKDINELVKYLDQIDTVCVPIHICPTTHTQAIVMAKAAQRAEAFLRAKGLWVDSPEPVPA